MIIYEYGYKKNNYFKRNIFSKEAIEKYEKDIYKSAYGYIFENENNSINAQNIDFNEILKIGDFYIDLDYNINNKEDYLKLKDDAITVFTFFTAILGIDKKSIKIYFSGNKGFHFVIDKDVMNIKPRKDLNKVFKSMAEEIKKITRFQSVDTQIYDSRRLFRIENSVNSKSNLYKIPLTYIELQSFDIEDIIEIAKKPRYVNLYTIKYSKKAENFLKKHINIIEEQHKKTEENKNKINEYIKNRIEVTSKNITPCIKYILINGATEGYRNNSATALASFFMQKGYTKEETIEIIKEWNTEKCCPKIEEHEIKTLVESVYKHVYKYGCSKLSEISKCDENKCPIFSEI